MLRSGISCFTEGDPDTRDTLQPVQIGAGGKWSGVVRGRRVVKPEQGPQMINPVPRLAFSNSVRVGNVHPDLSGDVFNDPALSISVRSSDNSAGYFGAQSGRPSVQFG